MYMYVYTHAYASKQVLSACYAMSNVLLRTGSSKTTPIVSSLFIYHLALAYQQAKASICQ